MKQRILPPILIILPRTAALFGAVSILLLAVSSVSASSSALGLPAGTEGAALVPGNYCVSCHLAEFPWDGIIVVWPISCLKIGRAHV